MENREANKRIVYYDILNIISIIAVIAMHQNGIIHLNPMVRAWNTSLIVECICYFAVPVFLMITGATLMKYRDKYDTKTFFKKRFSKVLIPFLFWAAVMFCWKIIIRKSLSITSAADLLNAFFKSKEEDTYYFMFIILGIYLIIPLLSHLTEEKHRKTMWYIVIVYFIINSTIAPLLRLAKIEWNMNFSIVIGNYLIFVFLGYLLSTEDIEKKKRLIIYIGAVLGLIYRYGITYVLSKSTGKVDQTTWGYQTWNSVLLAVSVFLAVKQLFKGQKYISDKTAKIIATISSCTFGVYLIHQIVRYYEVHIFHINEYAWGWRTFGIILTYIISLSIVFIIKKIPILKRIVP